MSIDNKTAAAFANSWNNLPPGSVYTVEQFEDWFDPITADLVRSKRVLELGCGNGSLLVHMTKWDPSQLIGVDLGDSVIAAKKNLQLTSYRNAEIIKADLVVFNDSKKFDFVYSIGVLHHLKSPKAGFEAVIRNTKPNGAFHCWVYAREGNGLIVYLVDPLRKVACHFPWWVNKYFISLPLAAAYYLYAHITVKMKLTKMPLYLYSEWICNRNFSFFRHVVFDQLVTPVTSYISKERILSWLDNKKIDKKSTYLIMRNGNSWKFGGRVI
jgi:SAM-dependent methyltransferase